MAKIFKHRAMLLRANKKLVYTAMSKNYFYYRMFISKYVLDKNYVPLNPFMLFDYFLLDTVSRDKIREANNNVVIKADELWVFGPISNGVLTEILIAKEAGKNIKYFKIEKPHKIVSINKAAVVMEEDVKNYKDKL
jgi:hypothetical protein